MILAGFAMPQLANADDGVSSIKEEPEKELTDRLNLKQW